MQLLNQAIYKIRFERYWRAKVREAEQIATRPDASFSQYHEDIITSLLIGKVRSFIDIGANDGILYSNTFLHACRGASGLLFEPVRSTFQLCKKAHKHHKDVHCIHSAIGENSGFATITINGYSGLFSTIGTLVKGNPSETSGTERIEIHTLEKWLSRWNQFREVDLLSVDVEGHEPEVFAGIDFERFSAKVIITETDDEDQKKVDQVRSLLSDRGYIPILKTPFNTIHLSNRIPPLPDALEKIRAMQLPQIVVYPTGN